MPKIQELWLDIGAKDEAEAREAVRIGDPVTLELGFHPLRNDLASAAGMDDRVGVWVVFEALRLIQKANPQAAVFAVSTVQEEIGLRGAKTSAFAIDPQVGIAVDVTHATDCPGIDQNQFGRVQVGPRPGCVSRAERQSRRLRHALRSRPKSTKSPCKSTASRGPPLTMAT